MSFLFTIIQISLTRDLRLSTFRVIRREGTRLKNAAHLSYCHCCELCALKQKPGVLLEKTLFFVSFFGGRLGKQKTTKSRLQTVLITASGPQAFNALVHRERYTQGSRQTRCVSSQDALALRANARGTEVASGFTCLCRVIVRVRFRPLLWLCATQRVLMATILRWATTSLSHRGGVKPARELPTQNCLRRGIQLYN